MVNNIINLHLILQFNEKIIQEINDLIDKFTINENRFLFIIVPNTSFNNKPITYYLKEFKRNKFKLIDELIWINEDNIENNNIFSSIMWYSKTLNYNINKDYLRVEHIWKDFEWGKRKKNYNPKGKDPSNVWLSERSKNAKIYKYEFLNINDIISKLILFDISENNEYNVYSRNEIDKKEIIEKCYLKSKIKPSIKIIEINET